MKIFINMLGILILSLMILGCSEKEEVQIP